MTGSRYFDWTHVHVEGGDRAAAAPYIGDARKLLGAVFEEAAVNGLGVYALTRKLDDGTVIVAEKHGEIPRVTIAPAPRDPQKQPTPIPDDFVVWGRTSLQPGGIDADRPQQILRPAWRTFFNDAEIPAYEPFLGEKGTYGGVLPDGLLYAGNIDWEHADKSRLSWYGPSARYWYDVWRQPRAQYGKHVFQLGRIVLDVDAYCTASEVDLAERWVLGAGRRGAMLYVVMAALPPFVTWPTPPTAAEFGPDAWSTPLHPEGAIPVVLRRFVLASQAGSQPARLVAVAGTHHDLWSGTIDRAVSPFHFDAKCERAVAHLPAAQSRMYFRGLGNLVRPSATHARVALVLSEDRQSATLETSAVTMGTGTAAGVFAEDGEDTLEVARMLIDGDAAALAYRLRGHAYPAFLSVWSGSGPSRWLRRQIMWADLRAGVLVLWSEEVAGSANPWTFTASVVLCRDGAEQVLWTDSNAVNNFVSGDVLRLVLDRLNAAAVAPMALAHLLPMGAMTDAGGAGTFDAQASLLHPQWGKPARKSEYYGQVVFSFAAGPWTNGQSVADVAGDIAANTQVDVLGRHTHPGFASGDGWTLVSYPMNAGINGQRVVIQHAADGAVLERLDTLTGVVGANTVEAGILGYDARFHPIWLLGQPPRGIT